MCPSTCACASVASPLHWLPPILPDDAAPSRQNWATPTLAAVTLAAVTLAAVTLAAVTLAIPATLVTRRATWTGFTTGARGTRREDKEE